MATLLVLFVLTITASGSLAAVKSTRIVGGQFAESDQFPYQVAIMSPSGTVFCGGSILNDKFILTAGQCVNERDVAFLRIMVGSNLITPPGPIYEVEAKHVHQDYIKNKLDIALLKLKIPLNIDNKTVAAIKIHEGNFNDGEEVTISGWGGTGDRGSNQLKYAKGHIGSSEECPKTPESIFESDYVLCLAHDVDTGFCGADTGGPAVYNNELIGEAIFINGKCGTKPNGYQRVSYFNDWITSIAFKE